MKRRDFLAGTAGIAGSIVVGVARSEVKPCPPPTLSIEGAKTATTPCEASSLYAAASTLQAGQSVLFPVSTQGLALRAATGGSDFHYSKRWHKTSTGAWFVGKVQASTGGVMRVWRYSEAANTWARVFDGFVTGSFEYGHNYDHSFIDESDNLYFRPMALPGVYRWTGSGWTQAFSVGALSPGDISSFAWHPHLFGTNDGGVVIIGEGSSAITACRKSTGWTFTTLLSGYATFTYNNAACYSAANNAVYCFDDTGRCWKVSPGSPPTATKVANTPSTVGWHNGDAQDRPLEGPNGDMLILENREGSTSARVWKWMGSAWTQQSYSHPFLSAALQGGLLAGGYQSFPACDAYGAMWAVGQDRSDVTQSLLWKPG